GKADPLQNSLLSLFAKTLELLNLQRFASRFEIFQCFDPQLLVKQSGFFRTYARNSEESQNAFRHLRFELLQHRQRAGRGERHNLGRQIVADAGDFLQSLFAFRDEADERLVIIAHRASAVAIRADAKWIGPLEVENVTDQVESVG